MSQCYRRVAVFNCLLALCLVLAANVSGEEPETPPTRMSPELLWKLGRLGNVTLSDDGNHAIYTVRQYDLEENSGTSSLLIMNLKDGSTQTLLKDWKSIGDVQFGGSPFGKRIYVTGQTGKEEEGSNQVWSVNPVDGGAYQVSDVEDGVANLKVSPTGQHIAFTVDVKLDDEVTDLYEDLPEADARIIDSLMFRHWNAWHDFKYSHIHVAALDETGRAKEAIDLMPDMKVDCPVPPFGGSEQFCWSPDGKQIAYTAKIVDKWAESTDSDVYIVAADGGSGTPLNITDGMDGYDNDPVFSPDGKYLAFHSMERPGFEADRNRVMIYDMASKNITDATAGLDQTAHGAQWTPDSNALLFTSETQGTQQIFRVPRNGGGAQQITKGRFNWGLAGVTPDGNHALVTFRNMLRPDEMAIVSTNDGTSKTLTHVNDEHYEHLELPTIEQRWVTATDGKKIHCWVIFPPGFDKSKKWPMLTYCQGGPQGQIGQWFSFRWNFHLMAAQDYVVLAPNRRGLPGFGREWNDQISGDWGGQAMQDLLSATDDMLKEPYVDKERTGAIGASFGGYTVYWMMGNHDDRFACMIAHCGVMNLESMYGSTEELFFVNWDLGGPYWKGDAVQEKYDLFSPHRFIKNWKTPLLVIHGQKDFRVPVTQGIEAFTAAQVQDVPSRFLYFPEEGHWVLGPQNGVLWHRVFFDWLDRYLKP